MPHVIVLGSCDTKLEELLFLRAQMLKFSKHMLEYAGKDLSVTLVDTGRAVTKNKAIDVSLTENSVFESGSGELGMSTLASKYLQATHSLNSENGQSGLHGLVWIGDDGDSSLATTLQQAGLPLGFPKLLVVDQKSLAQVSSTIGQTGSAVMPWVAGDDVEKQILSNAAGGIVGMAQAYENAINAKGADQSS